MIGFEEHTNSENSLCKAVIEFQEPSKLQERKKTVPAKLIIKCEFM